MKDTNREKVIAQVSHIIDECVEINSKYVELEKELITKSGLDCNKLTNIQNLRMANIKNIISLSLVSEENSKLKDK